MSTPARAEQRRLERGRRRLGRQWSSPDANVGTLVGWCLAESDLPDTRKGTHDALLKMMGDKRTGGVSWLQYDGDHAREVLGNLLGVDGNPEELANHYRRLLGMLRERGGWIVIAMAEGRP